MVWRPPEVRLQRLEELRARVRQEGYPTRGDGLRAWAADYGIATRTLQRDLQKLRHEGVEREAAAASAPDDAGGGRDDEPQKLRDWRVLLQTVRDAQEATRNGQAIATLIRQERELLVEIYEMERELREREEAEKDFDARLEDLRRDLVALPAAARRRVRAVVLEVCHA